MQCDAPWVSSLLHGFHHEFRSNNLGQVHSGIGRQPFYELDATCDSRLQFLDFELRPPMPRVLPSLDDREYRRSRAWRKRIERIEAQVVKKVRQKISRGLV